MAAAKTGAVQATARVGKGRCDEGEVARVATPAGPYKADSTPEPTVGTSRHGVDGKAPHLAHPADAPAVGCP